MSHAAPEDLLNAIATDVSVAEFTRAMAEHPEWMPTRAPSPSAAPVPTEELDAVLVLSGLSVEERATARREARDPELGVRIAAHDLQIAEGLVGSTLSTQAAAKALERNPSSITRGVQEGRYFAVRVAGKLRLPEWQFYERESIDYVPGEAAVPDSEYVPLPNLSAVVPSIPAGLHPYVVAGFMATPQPELDGMTPIDWLTSEGDPGPVSELLTGLAFG